MTTDKTIKVWRLHPNGAPVRPADPTLGGEAPQTALRYCGPYVLANSAGYYVYSPVDMDVTYWPDREPSWEYTFLQEYSNDEVAIVFDLMDSSDLKKLIEADMRYTPRLKAQFSPPDYEPGPNVLSLWTGCFFETPPGWGLWMRSPVNREYNVPFRVDEGILETDWLAFDIWMNLRFYRPGETAKLRREGPPIAQLLPVPRTVYEGWQIMDEVVNADSEMAKTAFDRWVSYNHKKYLDAEGGEDMSTYHRERKHHRWVENDQTKGP